MPPLTQRRSSSRCRCGTAKEIQPYNVEILRGQALLYSQWRLPNDIRARASGDEEQKRQPTTTTQKPGRHLEFIQAELG